MSLMPKTKQISRSKNFRFHFSKKKEKNCLFSRIDKKKINDSENLHNNKI